MNFYYVLQALQQVTVVVGAKTNDGVIRVTTCSESADHPHTYQFNVPSANQPLIPGNPKWANYIKGVIQNYTC